MERNALQKWALEYGRVITAEQEVILKDALKILEEGQAEAKHQMEVLPEDDKLLGLRRRFEVWCGARNALKQLLKKEGKR